MGDRERRWEQQLKTENMNLTIVAVWWAVLVAGPLYLIVSMNPYGPYFIHRFVMIGIGPYLPIVLGLPAGIALHFHIQRVMKETMHPGLFRVQSRLRGLIAIGIILSALMPFFVSAVKSIPFALVP